ncbi:MAG TPA: hypothetical protein VIL85_10190 [Thermomicrobiales bacterium]
MRRFDTPPAPPGWAGQGAELLRIVDPRGRAIAWLAPGFGGACVGYAVRQGDDDHGLWHQILRAAGPRALRAAPLDYGCVPLGPTPAEPEAARLARWRFVERDPTAATCAVQCDTVRLTLSTRLDDGALHLDLLATNAGQTAVSLALAFRLCFADNLHVENTAGATRLHSDDGTTRLTLHAADNTAPRWQVGEIAGASIAIEAHTTAAPGAMIAPGAELHLGVVVGSQ